LAAAFAEDTLAAAFAEDTSIAALAGDTLVVVFEEDTLVVAFAGHTSAAPDILAEVAVATYLLVVVGAAAPANTVDLAQIDLAD
jgi:hypothetical protein